MIQKTQFTPCLGTPFRIESETVVNGPGEWSSTKVSIFRDNKLIGEYLRNYHSFSNLTFYPFRINDQWYALYSAHYTATRVMKLYEDRIEDWCGEEPSDHGFCPVELYVPRFNLTIIEGEEYYTADCDVDYEEFLSETKNDAYVKTDYFKFGFLCGCVWGDDTSWKLRYIDLSNIEDKELIITDKFGYWPIPVALTLRESINLSSYEPEFPIIKLSKEGIFNLETNKEYS